MPQPLNELKIKNEGGKAEIWLYGVVGDSEFSDISPELNKQLRDIDADEIKLYINSPGGSVIAGYAIGNVLAEHKAKVVAQIDGLCASIMTYIATSADEVIASENSLYMIHNAWGGVVGNKKDMRKYADLLEKIDNQLLARYVKRTGESEDMVRAWMDDETYFTGAEAMKEGFVDNLLDVDDEPVDKFEASTLKNWGVCPDVAAAYVTEDSVKKAKADLDAKAEKKADNKIDNQIDASPSGEEDKPANAENHDEGNDMPDENKAKEALAAERKRVSEINALFDEHDDKLGSDATVSALRQKAIDDGLSVGATSKMILAELSDAEPAAKAQVSVGEDGRLKAIKDAFAAYATGKEVAADNPTRSFDSMDFAREFSNVAGINTEGMDRISIAKSVFNPRAHSHSTSDFGGIITEAMNLSVRDAYQEYTSGITQIASENTVANFLEQESAVTGEFSKLLPVPEGDEYRHGTMDLNKEKVKTEKQGRKFSITWEAVINDQALDLMRRIPQAMGRSAARTDADSIIERLEDTTTLMSDGIALFDAAHNNTSGGALTLDAAGLTTAKVAMRKALNENGRVMGIMPRYMVVPVELEQTALELIGSAAAVGGSNSGVINVHQGTVQVIVAPELGDGTTWYLVGDPNVAPGLELTKLRGYTAPSVESAENPDVDGYDFKVRYMTKCNAIAYQGIYKAG